MSLRERTRPGLGIIERCHARYSDFRRDPFTNHRGDARLSFFRDTLRAVIAFRQRLLQIVWRVRRGGSRPT